MTAGALLAFAARLPRRLWRFSRWALGRRHYPWVASPLHRLLGRVARRYYGFPAPRSRAMYAFAAGLLKFRERAYGDNMNFTAVVGGPVTVELLRHAALWQQAVVQTPPLAPRAHANLRMYGDSEHVQVDRLMSLLLMSDVFSNINLYFDERAALDAQPVALTFAEEARRDEDWDLDVQRPASDPLLDDPAWQRIVSSRTGFDRAVNTYLKVAHTGALVVALGLPEDQDGFCDDSIREWTAAVYEAAAKLKDVSFVVLNRISDAAVMAMGTMPRGPLSFACRAGLTFADTVALAQKADAFVGSMDVFGVAARAARRPGVYIDPSGLTAGDRRAGIAVTRSFRPDDALGRLDSILGERYPRPRLSTPAAGQQGEVASYGGSEPSPVPSGTRPRSSLAAQYTLLVPTYNRHELLARLLAYLARADGQFPVLVLDSSMPEARERNARLIAAGPGNVQHLLYPPTIDPYVKMREGFSKVRTPYCSLCADDDLVVVSALGRCLAALQADGNAAVAHGYYFNFTDAATFDLTYIVYRGASLAHDTSLTRVRTLFAAYEAVLYGVYRTDVARRVFRDVDRMNTVLGRELLTAALTALMGKVLRIPGFYYGRSTGESLSYTAWHPHQILAISPAALFEQYPLFRRLVVEAIAEQSPGTDLRMAGDVLDLVMMRYLGPFLRADVIDLILDGVSKGEKSDNIVNRIWDVFVRTPNRTVHPTEPLSACTGRFAPDSIRPNSPRDYVHNSKAEDGKRRTYRVLYEFLFPDMAPPAVVGRDELMPLLELLDAY